MTFFSAIAPALTDYPSEITAYAANGFDRRIEQLAEFDLNETPWSDRS